MDEPRWTLDELAAHAQRVLAAEGVRAPNGRVRELGGDGRAIRWYAMKGLVDKPSIGPGHSARYGERHLLQLVAVKRLQSQGRTLAEIQRELAGATDETLRAVADLGPLETEFVAAASAAAPKPAAANRAPAAGAPAPAPTAEAPAPLPDPTAASTSAPSPTAAAAPAPTAPTPARAARFWTAAPATALAPTPEAVSAEVRYLITLTDDVTLTLSAQPDAADLAAIRAAAAPLLDLLAERGLTTTQGD